jgi:hypothetical protein
MTFINVMNNTNNSKQNNNYVNPIIMRFSRKTPIYVQPANKLEDHNKIQQNDPKKIKWGAPTWFLFHTMAHKVNDDAFCKIKNDIFNNIVIICRNLPCPKCSAHATEYMSKININSIQSKDDLKNMLFIFHNEVNTRTSAPLFSYSDLNDKYSLAVTINVLRYFFYFFKDNSFNVTAIANSMHRDRMIEGLKKWFQNNIQYFDP